MMTNLIQRLTREDLELFEEATKMAVTKLSDRRYNFAFVGIFGSAADNKKDSYHDIDFATIPFSTDEKGSTIFPGQAMIDNMALLYAVNGIIKKEGRYLSVVNNWEGQEAINYAVKQNVGKKGKVVPVHNFIFIDGETSLGTPHNSLYLSAIRNSITLYGNPRRFDANPSIPRANPEVYNAFFRANMVCQPNLPPELAIDIIKSKFNYIIQRYDVGVTEKDVANATSLTQSRKLVGRSLRFLDEQIRAYRLANSKLLKDRISNLGY